MYRPWLNRRFGVEIELIRQRVDGSDLTKGMMRSAIAQSLAALQLPGERLCPRDGYYHSDGTTWDVKTDSSCGWEIASPVLLLDDEGKCQELREVCQRLQAKGAQVNRTCGLHVHIETRNMTWLQFRRLIRLWARYEPFLFSLVPPSRRQNHYCRSIYSQQWGVENGSTAPAVRATCTSDTDRTIRTNGGQCSARGALNLAHYWHSSRIEVRLHQGTVSALKIEKWVMLLMALVERAYRDDLPEIPIPMPNVLAEGLSTEYICRTLGLLPSNEISDVPEESLRLVQWLTQRQQQFAQPASVLAVQRGAQTATPRSTPMGHWTGGVTSISNARNCEAVMGLHVAQVYDGQPEGNCSVPVMDGQRFCLRHREDVMHGRPFQLMLPVRESSPQAVLR